MPQFNINKTYFGQVISLLLTPLDFFNKENKNKINTQLINLITTEYNNGTKCFGLGNLNKSYFLNNGGLDLIDHIPKDVKLWTGDSMTCASIYNYIIDKKIDNIFFIGGTGKIGKMLCKLLLKKNIKITCYTELNNFNMKHNNLKITANISDIDTCDNILIGKYFDINTLNLKDKTIYDYTVPFITYTNATKNNIKHVQLGVLKVPDQLLSGYYDICFGLDQNHIFACYAGCLINFITNREKNEVGEISESDVMDVWAEAQKLGFKLVN
jgi:hypothetical protein